MLLRPPRVTRTDSLCPYTTLVRSADISVRSVRVTRKAIFITGGGSGIGLATARHFAGQGWFVGLADVNAQGIDETRSEEHTSELQSLMRSSYAVFCLTNKNATRIILHTSTNN